ncbi:hypothetical protein WOLCODRAFT_154085 [Wolfiporia cocos MD-104 SS10]|uniref:F-box domain-containing protein n=1 Tax=Wolfiporia cocos (strain MD-104) TaxID=742152 RepID=A0A2H3K1N6_WOLCO|nr:hypothetical protein WOLCODRAFT_154085 [Wolfiporia cocos MD-104 SS10]
MEIEHWPSFLASRYLNPALSIGVPSKTLLKYEMTDEMDRQPAASCIIEGSAFDVEARVLREIEWRPPREWWELLPSRRDALLPQFYSETVASRIPIGLWDRILGYLANEREALGIVEEKDILVLAWKAVAEEGKQRSRGDNQRSLAHVGTFAAMFAGGHLPRLSALSILDGEWTPGAIPQSVFLHLSSFHSITSLELHDIILPSITVLLRLVCAFDRLQELIIRYLRLLDTRVPPASRRWAPSPNLKKLTFTDLNWPDELRTLYVTAELETSGGSETVLFLLNAVSCSDLNHSVSAG